jgi:hypothetical protein
MSGRSLSASVRSAVPKTWRVSWRRFRKHGQQTILALVTDDAGNVLQLIRHNKG